MCSVRQTPIAVSIAFSALAAPEVSLGESIYTKMSVSNDIDCAAVILALGNDSSLATEIASYFVGGAVTTLESLDGREPDVARAIVQARLTVEVQEILFSLQTGTERAKLEEDQRICIHGRFQ